MLPFLSDGFDYHDAMAVISELDSHISILTMTAYILLYYS